jgi:hypothetical protein
MQIKVKKTDKRMNGHGQFKYYVDLKHDRNEPFGSLMEKFFELRQWCWETWGISREVTEYSSKDFSWLGDQNKHWSWVNDQYRARLYLANKEEAALFTLKWA